MGIEKLLPTFSDLEVFLQLLPRSSTGERMNPYTSLWTGVTPGDGPQEFHLILLDNGRTNALADEVGRAALHCIRCSACLNVCPVYTRTGGHAYGSVYPGPIGAVLTPQLTGMHGHDDLELLAAVRVVAVRGLLRRLPGEDRHPEHCWSSSGPGRWTPTAATPPGGWDAAMKAAAWVMSDEKRFAAAEKGLAAGRLIAGARARSRTCRRRCPAGPAAATCPHPRHRRSGTGAKTAHRRGRRMSSAATRCWAAIRTAVARGAGPADLAAGSPRLRPHRCARRPAARKSSSC